jgi:chemosensory pili system protein ChpC
MAERLLEVYCVLVPLADGRLILPRSCVAEVVGHTPPAEMPGAPPWYLGTFAWSGAQVPLVSFEGICGQPIPPVTGRTRLVIVHCLGDELEGGVFGLVAQGFPQVVRVTSDVVRPDNSRPIPDRWPVLTQLRMMNEAPLVPDLERLEQMIAEETSVTG